MIRLQFVRGSDFGARAISWFSSGHLSHVDCVLDDGSLLGARSDLVGGKPAGVQIRPRGYTTFTGHVSFDLPATPTQKTTFMSFLCSQVDKPYDKLAIIAFLLDRNWRDMDGWICSELQAAALEAAGLCPQLYLAANKVTPVSLALVMSALGAVVVP